MTKANYLGKIKKRLIVQNVLKKKGYIRIFQLALFIEVNTSLTHHDP